MVSERQLSRRNRFWWSCWAPGLDERWLAAVSLGNSKPAHRITQWACPLTSSLPPGDSDLVAETAFGIFACALENGMAITSLAPEKVRIVVAQAVGRIELLRGSGRDLSGVVTPDHIAFAKILANRLLNRTAVYSDKIEIQPRLPGTGIVDACHPDLIAGIELIEVKMARTIFRLSDIRQVLVYLALAWLGTDRRLESVSLINPMLGISWNFDLKALINEISGESPARFFDKFDRLSRGEVIG